MEPGPSGSPQANEARQLSRYIAAAAAATLTAYTSPFNLTGLPAISIPCGVDANGLPIGLQLVAGPWAEPRLLRIARAYERATSWHERRPR